MILAWMKQGLHQPSGDTIMIKTGSWYKAGKQLKKTQDWTVGNTVKVGFLILKVVGCEAVNDGLPDIYTLESLDGVKKYEFIPHNGLSRIA